MTERITVTVNGVARTDEVEARLLLVHYLREVRNLTGTHLRILTKEEWTAFRGNR